MTCDPLPDPEMRKPRSRPGRRGFLKEDRKQTQPRSRFDGMTLEELDEQERLYDRLEAQDVDGGVAP